jgi:hypothetical protein
MGYVQRDRFWLTPIEAKFYDAARESSLFFAVQPWIQGTDRRYRPDFMFFYDGRPQLSSSTATSGTRRKSSAAPTPHERDGSKNAAFVFTASPVPRCTPTRTIACSNS